MTEAALNVNGTMEKPRAKERTFTKLGYTKSETQDLVKALNILLANYAVHHQKLRNFHWNVTGSDFFDVHEKLEEQYHQAAEAIDTIAERVRVFGRTPTSTMREYLDTSDIQESGTDLDAHAMVKEVLADQRILLEHLFSTLDRAIAHGDSGTEDLVKGYIRYLEKRHWMLTAFTKRS
ncbi:MAG: DNA starvation/stationary phase protection protein [Flavobacteriales bacterium]|nr:DNA starvation/stationary phase protection protein [Flavobacteriales bacterium]MCB0814461.1 DNA starvation/stationary phase protection protein [Flavobacteriales bacterium]HOP44094.1 DNA starvation/stationary phase protection protein [Flavobacteriales bacterium]HPF68659.1 DNA starvation/stationary phase protection protein [Flavobacteriales bacterium]HPJ53214.1 DNA starvation/stationary phase protection protein [Flavobacteriales bacterium]